MKRIFTLFYLCTLAVSLYAGTTVTGSIQSGGLTRTYRLYVPSIYNANNPACPLIINMHGYTSNASDQQLYTNFMPIADTANFLMVYPQGTLDNTNTTFWNAGVNNGLVDDISFLSDLIDTLKANYNINPNRVYSTGFSNGGFMSHVLACALNNKIAAIAAVSGTFFTYQFPYNPGKAVPVMHIHGTNDPTVPYNGQTSMLSAEEAVNFWVTNNNCNSTPAFTAVANSNTTDLSTAEHYVYTNGDNGSTVEFFKIIGGAHSWPGAFNIGVVTNEDINASKEIWRFFSQYTLNNISGIANHSLTNNSALYPNPTKGIFTIELPLLHNENADLKILNDFGQAVLSATYNTCSGNNKFNIDLSNQAKGVYTVQIKTISGITTERVVVN
jgi:polyhydroxybutyrate depolymerase